MTPATCRRGAKHKRTNSRTGSWAVKQVACSSLKVANTDLSVLLTLNHQGKSWHSRIVCQYKRYFSDAAFTCLRMESERYLSLCPRGNGLIKTGQRGSSPGLDFPYLKHPGPIVFDHERMRIIGPFFYLSEIEIRLRDLQGRRSNGNR